MLDPLEFVAPLYIAGKTLLQCALRAMLCLCDDNFGESAGLSQGKGHHFASTNDSKTGAAGSINGNAAAGACCAEHPGTVQHIVAWSHSLTTLQWIAGDSHCWKTCFRNPVVNIQEVSTKHSVSWKHCPGSESKSDLASHGTPVRALETERWKNGLHWLLDRSNGLGTWYQSLPRSAKKRPG